MTAGFRLVEQDEYPHPPGPEKNFNESVYGNAFDAETGIGGWMRVGNRVHEGYAEKSVVLYLPDGRIACAFGRPPISANDRWVAEGLTIETITPFRHQRITYRGEVLLIDDPELLRDPKRMMTEAPRTTADISWDYHSTNPLHGGVPTDDDQPTMYGRDFSLGHFNQHAEVTGHIAVGNQRWSMNGHGWRDHSWGPRYWSNLFIYRLLLATFENGDGLMLLKLHGRDGRARSVGALLIDGIYHEVMDLSIITKWNEAADPIRAEIGVRTPTASHFIEVESLKTAPLRNRRQDGDTSFLTRIAETHARFHWNGRTAWGMSEYIDRIEDGSPAGPPV